MNNKFYLNTITQKVYCEDKKKMQFVSLQNPEDVIKFVNLLPDEAEEFKEILPSNYSKGRNSMEERLFRIITDITTILFLTQDSFLNITKQVNKYLLQIEDYERICIVRDITTYYLNKKNERNTEIKDYINKQNKIRK